MKKVILLSFLIFFSAHMSAQYISDIYLKTDVTLGTGDVSPFWFNVNQHGLGSIHPNSAYLRAGIDKKINSDKRFDFAYGLDLVGGYNLDANVILQQAYADLKYRSLFLSIGSKERSGLFRNPLLSTGGTLISGNARPIPQVRVGFYDWVQPFKKVNWFKLKGDFSYGWFTDNRFRRDFIDKQDGVYVKNILYHHKYIAFQFGNDDTRFKVEAAYEIDQQFGGNHFTYKNGEIVEEVNIPSGFKDYLRAFLPLSGNENDFIYNQNYYQGNYVGEWQINLHYKINKDHKLILGFEKFWEDASGMSFQNRFDGLWSLEYKRSEPAIISGALFEYFQSTDQAGPCYWLPSYDGQETDIKFEANGLDNYYNHAIYQSWSHFGLNMGNPLIPSPVFNKEKQLTSNSNRIKAWNIGVNGTISSEWDHRILLTYMRGWGPYDAPFEAVKDNLSGLFEVSYRPKKISNLETKLEFAFNTGTLYGGESMGLKLGVVYRFYKAK